MSDLLLLANSSAFETDMRLLGHVFFPGAEQAFLVLDAATERAGIEAARWCVRLEARPDAGGLDWAVEVSVTGPDGERSLRAPVRRDPAESPRGWDRRMHYHVKGLMVDLLSQVRSFQPGWGVLTGVRPTKFIHTMLDKGLPIEQARERLVAEYRVTPAKADLVTEVAMLQRPFLNKDPNAISIYVGIPYCPSICSFCSFSAYPMLEYKGQVPTFLEALGQELELIGEAVQDLGLRVETIYLGGGTPTSPKDEDFEWMLDRIAATVLKGQRPDEYTVEAGRPETFTVPKLDAMARHGVSRLSVNPQSTVQATLMHLGRIHTVEKFYRAYDLVRRHPHPFIVNSDIIIGLPGEGPDEVAHTLEDMRRLAPDNLTVHTLAIKRGSRLHREEEQAAEALRRLTPEEAEAMVQAAAETARQMGQHPYYLYRQKFMVGSLENVGYSLPGMESIYNIQMMEERQTVIGIGGGATSKYYHPTGLLMQAPDNPKEPGAYIQQARERAEEKAAHLRLLYGERVATAR